MHNVDVVTVVNLLKRAGVAQTEATTDFGLLSGRAYKLMMLPTTLAAGIGIAVMPAVSAAVALGRSAQLANRVDTALRLTVLLSLPASVGLALLAKSVDIALFENVRGAGVIQVMALAILFASLQTVISAILQGSGWMYAPVLYLVLAAMVKATANMSWVPHFGIAGAAWSTVVSYVVATALNLWGLHRRFQATIPWLRWFGAPLLAALIMAGFVFAMERQWEIWGGLYGNRLAAGLVSLGIVQVGVVIYGLALLLTGAMTEVDLRSAPRVGNRVADWCIRFGFLRPNPAK
jgi:PST family polysaccharide transporter/stage V sporulation protein B